LTVRQCRVRRVVLRQKNLTPWELRYGVSKAKLWSSVAANVNLLFPPFRLMNSFQSITTPRSQELTSSFIFFPARGSEFAVIHI
jgi:hypothetical protein